MSFCKPLLLARARYRELIGDPFQALAAACAPSMPRQGETSPLRLGTWQQGSAIEKEENERREPVPVSQ